MNRISLAAALIAALVLIQGHALAQAYPTKSITLLVPFPPGTGNDVIGRALEIGRAHV